jgi:hypothetical protein
MNQHIEDERTLRRVFAYAPNANPQDQKAPAPRPDYALFDAAELKGFLDAKYRDVWERRLPADWLYQLSIYALASPTRTSVLLYATMTAIRTLPKRVLAQGEWHHCDSGHHIILILLFGILQADQQLG